MAARCARGILLTYVFHFVFGGRWVLLPARAKKMLCFTSEDVLPLANYPFKLITKQLPLLYKAAN